MYHIVYIKYDIELFFSWIPHSADFAPLKHRKTSGCATSSGMRIELLQNAMYATPATACPIASPYSSSSRKG